MSGTITGPIAYLNNLPIESQFYEPSKFNITAITLGKTTIITTATDNNYVVGQNIRTIIPLNYGTYQLNGRQALVVSLPAADQVEINIDSTLYDSFIFNPPGQKTPAQIIPIGDFNSGKINNSGRVNTGTFIPGSFINISPL